MQRGRGARLASLIGVLLILGADILLPRDADAQFGRRLFQAAACAGGAAAGLQIAGVLADLDAKRQNLSAEEAERRRRGYQIGVALALCAGGAAIADSIHGQLSERGRRQREEELQAAAADANPRTYRDPDNPRLEGRITPQPVFVEGNEECRVIEDYLADGTQGESAFVKYCRQPPDGQWQVKTT